MAIITFKSNELKETGQTLSMVAIATQMAIEHSYKILIVSTNFKDQTLENCFWELDRLNKPIIKNQGHTTVGVTSGIEGLIKVLVSNKTSTEIVKNYSKTVLRDRLDILLSPETEDYEEYTKICGNYSEILRMADRYYDLVFVDLSSRMHYKEANDILSISDLNVINITQRLKTFDDFMELRDQDDFYKKTNVMLAIGRYDKFSKYNNKNITRYLKEKKPLAVIPYNTLLFEACSEGTIIDFLLKIRNITDEADRNYAFLKEIGEIDKKIILREICPCQYSKPPGKA